MYADKHLVISRTARPPGLRFAGEIDISNSWAVVEAIRGGLADGAGPHLDLRAVSFCDISGIRGLLIVARELGDGRRLLLHGLPAQIENVITVTGWTDMAGLHLCACEIED
jgi:anti-anti-sigma factor